MGGGIKTAKTVMKVNKKYNKTVREAMAVCKDEIIENIASLLKENFRKNPKKDRVDVVFRKPVYYLNMEKVRGTVLYTPKMAERIGVSGLNSDKGVRLMVIEGPETFSPLEWLDLTTLGRVFAELLETAKAE